MGSVNRIELNVYFNSVHRHIHMLRKWQTFNDWTTRTNWMTTGPSFMHWCISMWPALVSFPMCFPFHHHMEFLFGDGRIFYSRISCTKIVLPNSGIMILYIQVPSKVMNAIVIEWYLWWWLCTFTVYYGGYIQTPCRIYSGDAYRTETIQNSHRELLPISCAVRPYNSFGCYLIVAMAKINRHNTIGMCNGKIVWLAYGSTERHEMFV